MLKVHFLQGIRPFLAAYTALPPHRRVFYEVVPPATRIKLFFDLDLKPAADNQPLYDRIRDDYTGYGNFDIIV